MGNVEELQVDERGRLQLTKDIRAKLGLSKGGRVRARVENGNLIVTPPISREAFISRFEGAAKGGEPPMDPSRLKDIWEQPKK